MNTHIIKNIVKAALKEDASHNDITSKLLVPKHHTSKANIFIKEKAVVCGLAFIKEVFKQLDPKIQVKFLCKEGTLIKKRTTIASLKGNTRALLTGERTALNFLSYLSGIATTTHQYVDAIKPCKAKILDTRKTTPSLRTLEKYAVRCGGGANHRFDLSEMVLIKDNHRETFSPNTSLYESIKKIQKQTKKPIEVEVDTLAQFNEVVKASPQFILLDNMSYAQMKRAVALNKKIQIKKRPLLEASGGITLKSIKAVARTGVDRISIGALTHTHKATNVSMETIL